MERVLVTGGAGFIGSHLARELVAKNYVVRILDNFASGDPANLEGLQRKTEFMEGDVRNAVACRNACRNVDRVYHLAALVSAPQSALDPVQTDAVNNGGTLNLLLAARDYNVKRFVFGSSCAVYGEAALFPTPETALPAPTSPYGLQKLTGEHYCRIFTRLYGLETVSLRYSHIYGPRQNVNGADAAVIPKFFAQLLKGESPTVFGDGEQTRDFCFVKDAVAASLLAAETSNPKALGSVFNIGSGKQTTINELLKQIQNLTGAETAPQRSDERPGDIRHSCADIMRAKEILGYAPKITLRAGLKETFAFYARTLDAP